MTRPGNLADRQRSGRWKRIGTFILPGAILLAVVLSAVVLISLVDSARSSQYRSPWSLLLPDSTGAIWTMALVGTAEALAIAIVIVVVVLGVQLTADRYSPRIIDIFVRDPLNGLVLALFLGSILFTIWISAEVKGNYVPIFGVATAVGLALVDFAILLPYVRHIFQIMRGEPIIEGLQERTAREFKRALADPEGTRRRHALADALKQTSDIALGSIQRGDTSVCVRAVEVLGEFLARDYVPFKRELVPSWFEAASADMPGVSPEVRAEVGKTRTWIEYTVLSDFLDIMGETPGFRNEVTYAIAHATGDLGRAAIRAADHDLEDLVLRFLNTYLRASVNQRAARFAYSTMNEYRQLATELMETRPELLMRAAEHLLYYGRLFEEAGIPFIIAIAAEDVAALAMQVRFDPNQALLLARLLARTLEETASNDDQLATSGLLVASVRLALYGLSEERDDLVEALLEGIHQLPAPVVAETLDRIAQTRNRVFFEVTERVVSFDWVEKHLAAYIPTLRERLQQPVDTGRPGRSEGAIRGTLGR